MIFTEKQLKAKALEFFNAKPNQKINQLLICQDGNIFLPSASNDAANHVKRNKYGKPLILSRHDCVVKPVTDNKDKQPDSDGKEKKQKPVTDNKNKNRGQNSKK